MTDTNKKEDENIIESEIDTPKEEVKVKKIVPRVPINKNIPNFPNGNHFKGVQGNNVNSKQRQGRGASRGR